MSAAAAVIERIPCALARATDSAVAEAAKRNARTTSATSYPLHPDVLETFTEKTATLANFQRVRGMLRILGRTVARLWESSAADATAIHLHHIDPGYEPIRQEIVTRLGNVDVCAGDPKRHRRRAGQAVRWRRSLT